MWKIGKVILWVAAVAFLAGRAQKADGETGNKTYVTKEKEADRASGNSGNLEGENSRENTVSWEDTAGTDETEALRQLYLDFPQTADYQDAVSFIQESQLPYSETKLRGSRLIKIALDESDAAIDSGGTFKDYDYIEISYMYPKSGNNQDDELDQYFFAGIIYVSPEGMYQLSSHAEGTFITVDGEVIDSQMDRQEQMYFLETHRDSAGLDDSGKAKGQHHSNEPA